MAGSWHLRRTPFCSMVRVTKANKQGVPTAPEVGQKKDGWTFRFQGVASARRSSVVDAAGRTRRLGMLKMRSYSGRLSGRERSQSGGGARRRQQRAGDGRGWRATSRGRRPGDGGDRTTTSDGSARATSRDRPGRAMEGLPSPNWELTTAASYSSESGNFVCVEDLGGIARRRRGRIGSCPPGRRRCAVIDRTRWNVVWLWQ